MSTYFILCYILASMIGVFALSMQMLMRKKNLSAIRQEIKTEKISLFITMSVLLNIGDFVLLISLDGEITVHIEVMSMIINVLWFAFDYSFIEMERLFSGKERIKLIKPIFFAAGGLFILAEVINFTGLWGYSAKLHYMVCIILSLLIWAVTLTLSGVYALATCIRGKNKFISGLMLAYLLVFIMLGTADCIMLLGLRFWAGDCRLILCYMILWIVLQSLNVMLVWKNCAAANQDIQHGDGGFEELLDAAEKHFQLNSRERELVRLICEGKNNCEIAAQLGIAENTVKSNNYRLFKKLDAENRVQVINKIKDGRF